MSIFSRLEYALVNSETKEDVYVSKVFLEKSYIEKEIENDNLPEGLYRLEERRGGKKERNAWMMKKPRKKLSAEEVAAKTREEAEAYIQQSAKDIKKAVEDHQAFVAKVKETYGIEGGGGVDHIQIPTGKDGNLGIMEAFNLAIAESTYEGVRATKPAEVAAAVKSVMDSGTTILAGIAQMLTTRMMEIKKPKVKKEVEKKKEELEKKLEPKPEPKKEEVETHKEDIGDGKTKITFGSDASTDPAYQHQKIDTTFTGSDTPRAPVTYEEYRAAMLGNTSSRVEEEVEEEPVSE